MRIPLIGPAYRHIFGCNSVEAEVTSIRERGEIQRTLIRFDPFTVRVDGVIAGSNAAVEGCKNEGQEEHARHSSLTPNILQSSRSVSLSTIEVETVRRQINSSAS